MFSRNIYKNDSIYKEALFINIKLFIFSNIQEMVSENGNLIIALDHLNIEQVTKIIDWLSQQNETIRKKIILKVNDLLALVWMHGIQELFQKYDFHIMLDPKWHDIPNTLENYFSQLYTSWLSEKTKYVTLHASWGIAMMQAAVKKRNELWLQTKILAITALTSLEAEDTQYIYWEVPNETVLKLAQLGFDAWVDGVVCSPLEAPLLRSVFWEKFLLVTPWVRFEWSATIADQKRISTPKQALENGVTDIVMGRDILTGNITGNIERFFKETTWIFPNIQNHFEMEKILSWNDWVQITQYIGAMYFRPEWWKYCRYTSGVISNSYTNIGVIERNYKIVNKAMITLAKKLREKSIVWDVVMGAQMGSIRLSLALATRLWISESIYTEKWWEGDKEMLLKRHDIDLEGKKVILSEDIITKWSTLKKMISLVEQKWGTVVGITCIWNRSWKEEFEWIPLLYCFVPPAFDLYYDEKTPLEQRANALPFPGWEISEKPKNDWEELVLSMRK